MRAWVGWVGLSLLVLLLPTRAALGGRTDSASGIETVEFAPGIVNLVYYAEEFRPTLGANVPVPALPGQIWYGAIRRRLDGDSFREKRNYVRFAVSYENGVATRAVCDVNGNGDLRDDHELPAFSYPSIPKATAFLAELRWDAHYEGKTYPIDWLLRIVAQPLPSPDGTPLYEMQRVQVPMGEVTLAGVNRKAVLYDGDWNGIYTSDFGDGVFVDVDGDRHLVVDLMSPEFGPFRIPFQLGTEMFEIQSVDPMGRALRIRRTGGDRESARRGKAGEVAPDFLLQDMDGRVVRLSSLRGKTVLLDFWASWCGGCEAQAPKLKEIYDAYHARGLEILGISYDTDRAAAEKFRQKHALPWPVEFTGRAFWENRIGRLYGEGDAGAILVVNPDGILEGDFSDLPRLRDRLDVIESTTTERTPQAGRSFPIAK